MGNSFKKNENSISTNKKPLGEILIESGLITASQIEIALQEQSEKGLRIGKILASHNWIKQKTADFFATQWNELIQEKQKRPFIYYFRHSGLLDEDEINSLVEEQKKQEKQVRFHRLAVEKGYVKQITVDYFLSNIFNIYHSNIYSFVNPYEILSKYNKGERNFRRTELSKAPLIGVSLKGIYLDGSNLKEAKLSSCNLSDSSLIQTNLSLVNLVKSVLTNVDFTRANLYQANMKEAHLKDANFTKANLQEADLTKAYLFNTIFAGTNLSKTRLPSEYSYEVYYDADTVFGSNFNPKQAGWKQISEKY